MTKPPVARVPARAAAAPVWVVCAGLFAAALVAYLPAWNGALLWDDAGHVTRADLQSLHGLWRIWFDVGATQQYYPLLHSAFWIEHRLWGDAVIGYHLVNIALHAASATVVALTLRRLSFSGWWLAGVIFALHPVHVESVAWIAEQKNTLSGLFYVTSAAAYLRFDAQRTRGRYIAALILFVCALLSKSVTATLPVALIVILWWRRGRVSVRDLLPLLPFVAGGVIAGAMTVWFEANVIGAQGATYDLGMFERVLLAGRIACFYAFTIVWPVDLAFVYPRWSIDVAVWWQYAFPAAVAVILAALAWRIPRGRGPLAAALFFLVTIAPALGFVNVYPFRFSYVADHFQYLASLGLIVPIAWLLARISPRGPAPIRVALPIAICVVLGVMTHTESRTYAGPETLYRETLTRNPGATLAHNNLAVLLMERRTAPAFREAVGHLRAVLAAQPDHLEARFNLSSALDNLGDARGALDAALEIQARVRPGELSAVRLSSVEHSIGRSLRDLDRTGEAVPHLRHAADLNPQSAAIQGDLGLALASSGQTAEGKRALQEARRLDPSSPTFANNLGALLLQRGEVAEAIQALQDAVRLDPSLQDARFNLDLALKIAKSPR